MRVIPPLILLLLVTGCAPDPYQRQDTWKLPPDGLGANDTNLRAMIVNPNDLVAGTRDDTSYGPLAVRPIDALVTGHRKPMVSESASQINTNGQQQQQQGQQGAQGGGQGGNGGTQ